MGRFIQPDTVVPEPGNPQALNRYSYGFNNPVKYVDGDGHSPAIPATIAVISKVIDYGWTGYDILQSYRVFVDPMADQQARDQAAGEICFAILFEVVEPDDLLPVGVPVDDVARKAIIKVGNEVGNEGVEQGLKKLTSHNFRENLTRFTGKVYDTLVEAHHVLPQHFEEFFKKAGIKIHHPRFGGWVDGIDHRKWSHAYNERWKEFLSGGQRTAEEILNYARELAEEFGFDVHF